MRTGNSWQGSGSPEGYSPVGTIVFGYPAELPEVHDKHPAKVKWVR